LRLSAGVLARLRNPRRDNVRRRDHDGGQGKADNALLGDGK
jgi:hypothetical protein